MLIANQLNVTLVEADLESLLISKTLLYPTHSTAKFTVSFFLELEVWLLMNDHLSIFEEIHPA